MSTRDAEEPLDDRELPDAADIDDDETDDEDTATAPCPACGAMIYEDAPQCPVCGRYVDRRPGDGLRWRDRPWWWTALALLGLAAVILALALT